MIVRHNLIIILELIDIILKYLPITKEPKSNGEVQKYTVIAELFCRKQCNVPLVIWWLPIKLCDRVPFDDQENDEGEGAYDEEEGHTCPKHERYCDYVLD